MNAFSPLAPSHKVFLDLRFQFLIDCVGLHAWQCTSAHYQLLSWSYGQTRLISFVRQTMAKRKEIHNKRSEEPESKESSSEESSSDDVPN